MYVGVSEGKKCYFFSKFCIRTKWMMPYENTVVTPKLSNLSEPISGSMNSNL